MQCLCGKLLTCGVRVQGALLGRSFFSFHKMGDAVSVTPFYSAPRPQHQSTGSTQTTLAGFAYDQPDAGYWERSGLFWPSCKSLLLSLTGLALGYADVADD